MQDNEDVLGSKYKIHICDVTVKIEPQSDMSSKSISCDNSFSDFKISSTSLEMKEMKCEKLCNDDNIVATDDGVKPEAATDDDRARDIVGMNKTNEAEAAENKSTSASIKKEINELTKEPSDSDPFGYLNRGDFSSEIFKIELTNLPKRFGISQLKKKLIHLGLSPCKIKSVEQGHFAFVTFRSEADRELAIKVLQGHTWKSRPIKVKRALPTADPLMLKRKLESEATPADDQPKPKMLKPCTEGVDVQSHAVRLNDVVTPLWQTPYDKQLEIKQKSIVDFLKRLGKDIEKNNPQDRTWLVEQRKIHDGLCCTLEPIKPSPVLNGYRNKCEFTIGKSPTGKDNTVGFRFGSYKDGSLSVLEPDECINIPDAMKCVGKALQSFLQRGESVRPSFDATVRRGYWKTATVRTNCVGDVMLQVVMHPQTLSKDELELEKDQLRRYFETLQGSALGVTSLYFQVESDRKEKYKDIACEHLLGEKFIVEDLLGMKFRISPLAFFQVNSSAAEVLYNTISDWCNITPMTTLLDICCGTGTIGLTIAKRVKQVYGLELCREAVDDAKINAQTNGVTNAEFLCGKAEDLMPSTLWRVADQDVVIIVDPPRAGLHGDVIRGIRKSPVISRLVYVACKPSAATQNIVDLTRQKSKRMFGTPFRLIKAVPVDMFPHTEHCELVLLLERQL